MAGAADVDTKELEICIKGLLISTPTVAKATWLQRECEQELGGRFPYKELGFPTFVDYLRSIPNVVRLEPPNGHNPDVYPIASKASKHIDQLVSKQKVPTTRRRGVARRSACNSRPPPSRRRPTAWSQPSWSPTPPINRCLQSYYPSKSQDSRSQADISFLYPVPLRKNGIESRESERYMTTNYHNRDQSRNGIHCSDNMPSLGQGDTKVYPKLAGATFQTSSSSNLVGIPAGFEDEFDDFDDEFEFYNEEQKKDSEEEMFAEVMALNGNSSSTRPQRSAEKSCANHREDDYFYTNSRDITFNQNEDLSADNSNISPVMINNFRQILDENPNGIWASQIQQLYFDQFHVPLDLKELGYISAIELADSLPSVFTFHREGSQDWKLYDARYVTQESIKAFGDGNLTENESYIPQTIIENIKKLLDDNPKGFRSTDLLQYYKETFRKPLDLGVLGFNKLEEFLMILKDDITLKKGSNYYVLLPKHKVVSYEALEPPKPDERLKVPAEELCVPIPENVMRLGEEIPMQELPEVETDPAKPLLDLEVRVAEVMSPVCFYITLDRLYEELENMMDDLDKFYEWEQENLQIPLPHVAVNLYCAVKFQDYWHRAKITRIRKDGDIEIDFIDYGTPGRVKHSELRYLSKEFTSLPAQAIFAKLIGVRPVNRLDRFPPEACNGFLSLVTNKRLVAHVFQVVEKVRNSQEKMQLELILYDVGNPNHVVLNDYLIEIGLASSIHEEEESSTEANHHVSEPLVVNNSAALEAGGSSNSLFSLQVNGSAPHPESSIITLWKKMVKELSSTDSYPLPPPRFPPLPLQQTERRTAEGKPIGPPPGFFKITKDKSSGATTEHPSQSPVYSSASQTQQPNQLSVEELKKLLISTQTSNPLSHKNQSKACSQTLPPNQLSVEELEKLFIPNQPSNHVTQEEQPRTFRQTQPQNYFSTEEQQKVFTQPSPLNHLSEEEQKFLINNYLLQPCNYMDALKMLMMQGQYQPQLPNSSNIPLACPQMLQPQQSITYSSFVPPVNPYNPPRNVYRQSQYQTAPTTYYSGPVQVPVPMLVNPSGYVLMSTPVPNQYYSVYQSSLPSVRSTGSSKVQECKDNLLPSQSFSHSPSPLSSRSTPTRSTAIPIPSPTSPAPMTVPERPPKILPGFSNSAYIETKSVPVQQIKTEPSEVNQIPRPITPLTPASAEVAKICKPSRPSSAASTSESTVPDIHDRSVSATSNSHSQEIEHNYSMCNSNQTLDEKPYFLPDVEITKIPLAVDIDLKNLPLPPSSPEILHSATNSPVEFLTLTSPTREESSDDYASASENIEEVKMQVSNITLTPQYSTTPLTSCEINKEIPDSWENLDLDDSPKYAANFDIPTDLIDNSQKSTLMSSNPVEKPNENIVKCKTPPLNIQVPINWKDIFNPDSNSFSECKKVEEKVPNPVKFDVKKIPLQKMKVQGKFFHLLYINNKPAVIVLEFFKQFVPNTNPNVAEKLIEVTEYNKFYHISRAGYPAILAELDKLTEFYGGVPKKTVIRLSKIKVINLSDVPQCLKVLNVPNKSLLEDLKKITQEFS